MSRSKLLTPVLASALMLLAPMLAAATATAQEAPAASPTLQDIEIRDQLVADQETLLNTYRCIHRVDLDAVPGGCSGHNPAQGPTQPGAFEGQPTATDIQTRDQLIAAQEALLNAYRCQFDMDVQLVPGGCTAQPAAGGSVAIAAGRTHSCAITTDRAIDCWGNNDNGQTDAPPGTYTAAAAGGWHSCGLKADGAITCWGRNAFGQSDPPTGTYTHIATGTAHSCAITTDRAITCWGNNEFGQSDPPTGTYTHIATGRTHSCAITTDRAAICWGNNDNGQLDPPSDRVIAGG